MGVELNMEIARHVAICIFTDVQFIKIKRASCSRYLQETDRMVSVFCGYQCKNLTLPLSDVFSSYK